MLYQQRPRRRTDKGHENIEFLIAELYHATAQKVDR